jgi:hypothetical protein
VCGIVISCPFSVLNLQRRWNWDLAQYSHAPILDHSDVASKMWTRPPVCCPAGTNDRSQAIYCLERRPNGNPSRRARSDPYLGLINRPKRGAPSGPNHTVPSGTVPLFAPIPGNKLPGLRRAQSSRYFHNVPTGQRHLTPVHEFDSKSLRAAGFEDSDSTELAEVLSDEAQALYRRPLKSASQARRAHNQDVGEVGRTSTR